MKTAVDRVGPGKVREVNARFSAMVSHYLFDAEFCNVASGWEKGQIEKNVQDSRHRVWQKVPAFGSLAALNDWLADQCVLLWQQTRHPEQDMTIWDAWSAERPHLMPVGQPFDGFVEHTKRVSPSCLVTFERNRYSVPASFATGVYIPTSVPSGSRNWAARLPQGIIFGSCTTGTSSFSLANSASTSSTWNSTIAVRLEAGSALPSLNNATVSAAPIARVAVGVTISANTGASHSACWPVTFS
jgi:hypothetical protein